MFTFALDEVNFIKEKDPFPTHFQLQPMKNQVTLAEEEQFQISVQNPFSMSLTRCEIRIDGAGLLFQDSPILLELVTLQFKQVQRINLWNTNEAYYEDHFVLYG